MSESDGVWWVGSLLRPNCATALGARYQNRVLVIRRPPSYLSPALAPELSSACAASPTLWMAPQYIHARWHAYRCVTYVQRRAIVRIRTCVDASSRRHSPDDIVCGSCTACGRSECHRQRCPRIDDQLI
jgi:hypothetical protein